MKIIVAADKNWGIGKDNKLLVSIPADMKMFRQETTGKVCVMGRKTLESFPGGLPLKNRINIVLTRNENYKVKDAIIVHSIEELMEELKKYPAEDVYCIGGDTIYKQLLPYCDAAQVTKIDFAYIADSYFPNLDEDPQWHVAAESEEQTYFDLRQIDDVIAREKSSENNEEVGFTPAMLTEMAGELRHALEQVSEPSAKEEKTELKKKHKQLKELEEHRDKLQEYD